MLAYWSKVDEKCQIDQDHSTRIVKKAMLAYWSKVDEICQIDQDHRARIVRRLC
jgi:hypothetical protein